MKAIAGWPLLLVVPCAALGAVNAKNGNFFITYEDIGPKAQPGKARVLELSRTYNSKSTHIGWFGFGWGSPFETSLLVLPSGSVVVMENGTGQVNRYTPATPPNLVKEVDVIVASAVMDDHLDLEQVKLLRQKLLVDENLRHQLVKQYRIHDELMPGEQVRSSLCEKSQIIRNESEYIRTTCEGHQDHFNLLGHLISHEEDSYRYFLQYDGMRPNHVEDSSGNRLEFQWTANGRLKEARHGKNGFVVTYAYDKENNLIASHQSDGNVYRYTYDDNHNMIRIGYMDDTSMQLTYDANSLVTSVTQRDGAKTTYDYRSDPQLPQHHFWTTITRWNPAGLKLTVQEEEFFISNNDQGGQHLARLNRSTDDGKEEIVFDEQSRIKSLKKATGEFAEYTYHPTQGKVTSVITQQGKTELSYDMQGNATKVTAPDGRVLVLGYDDKQHIISLSEAARPTGEPNELRKLFFQYGDHNRITRIQVADKGDMVITYDQDGEMSKVTSADDSEVAEEVSQIFQQLIGILQGNGLHVSM